MMRYAAAFLALLSLGSAQTASKLCHPRLIFLQSHTYNAKANAQSTASDVQNGVCAPVTLIFARGTTEPGNLGTIVGPPLASAMKTAFGDKGVAIQGVNYPADIPGATSGAIDPKDAAGAQNMVMLAAMAVAACPNTKIVLSGYSQGAEQVRGALMNMPNNKVAVSIH
jgi:cutinase